MSLQPIQYLNIIFLSCLLIFGYGCKKSPTFSADNELDIGSDNYALETPFNIQVELRENRFADNESRLIISWDYPRSEKYLKEFKIFRSDTDTSNFEEIGLVDENSTTFENESNFIYAFADHAPYNGINVWYKIRAIADYSDGSLFKDSEPFSFTSPEFTIGASLWSFIETPTITLTWPESVIDDNVTLEIYSKFQSGSDYKLEKTVEINDKTTTLPLDIYQPDNMEYYYKLVFNEIKSGFKLIRKTIIRPSLDFLNSTVFSENEAELHIGFKQGTYDYDLGNIFIDSYELDVLYSPIIEPPEFLPLQEINNTFTAPISKEVITDLQQDRIYNFRLTGSRGNFKTTTTNHTLYHKYNVVDTSSIITETNEISFPTGSFNESNTHFIVSSDGKQPLIIDVQNNRVEPSLALTHLNDVSSAFGNYKGTEAIITSSSSGNVLVWNPDTKELIKTIPNFSPELQSPEDYHPVDFHVISDDEFLIAYGDVNSTSRQVNRYYVTIWNNNTETHDLVYQVQEESMYSNQFKVAYYDNTLLMFYSYDSNEVKLVALNKDDLSIQKQTYFSQDIDGWSSFFNIQISDSGEHLMLYTENEALQIQSDNHEVFASIWNVRSRFDWSNIRGFYTSKEAPLTCYGADFYASNSPYYSQIQCSSNNIYGAEVTDLRVEGYLNGLILSDNGSKLGVILNDKIMIYTLENDWILSFDY